MVGKCHLCSDRKEVKWCNACGHFFCQDCRTRFWHRGLAAIKEMVGGRVEGCCGPIAEGERNA